MPASIVPLLVTRPLVCGSSWLTESFVGKLTPFQNASPDAVTSGSMAVAPISTLPAAVIRERAWMSSDVLSSISVVATVPPMLNTP